jgi:hypothetical protein
MPLNRVNELAKARNLSKEKRAGVHTVVILSPTRKPSFNRKNGAPVLKGNKNVAHLMPAASGF